ncbi:acetate/propionate family kinase [Pseudoflavonifractor phocaeensis]|uniref:acetate/propionate family kinase n=1 Tax=Pseudoflavonifractor phocaeensis TaxID=1870988 RepID=UPI00195A85C0|nr:acetate kinase [Pseudoflavonifractor phocaeensis]MBM6869996.1 acetate kinase [Pseudoflavonifractor phocaeensis]
MKVLVINAGSSSLKYQLMDPDTEEVFAKGLCERIGIDGRLTHKVPATDGKYEFDIPMPTHAEAIQAVLDALTSAEHGVIKSMDEIDAVGHRVVHGGEKFAGSVKIDQAVMDALEECIPLAPLHNPANITGIRACQKVMPNVPMVGVFDTAFHQTMPAKSYIYALPYEYYENDKVRRYGFHGTSHKYVAGRAAAMLGRPIEELKIVTCHLGNGSSVSAVDGGKSMDTSMGFTPLAGVPMGTRSGDLDAGILEYLMNKYGYDIKEMLNILNKKSGVQGISGVSSDFRDLETAAKEGNERAALALEAFQYSVKKLVGAYAAAMGGVDAIVFTAGVGENDGPTRMAIASGLEFMGVKMDAEANNVRGKEAVISAADSKVKVLLIPTNEELMIARDTAEIVGK